MSDTRFKSRPESVLEDPGARAVATLYAQSFLSAARQHGVADCQVELHAFLDDVLGKWPEFADVLMSDTVGRDEKLGILERVVAPRSSQFFVNFLQVLVRHGRLSMLPVIREVVVRLTEIESGKQRVRVRSARALTQTSRDEIRASLRGRFGFDPILEESVDAGLLGGMVLQVGDTVFDSSLRSRLKSLRARLVEKAFNEIQSGRDRFSHPEGD
jgi:F-type H+-transporting ATPase subunit delta